MRNIILIGFMGSGKTSVGIRLSYRLRRVLTDTDKKIERLQRMTVSEIFERFGEAEFRNMETQCLERLLEEPEGQIISVGGGLPMRSRNRELLRRLGTVVYLRVKAGTVCARLAADTSRPLLQGEDREEKVQRLLEKRAPVYESAAEIIVDVDEKTLDEIVDEILEKAGWGGKEASGKAVRKFSDDGKEWAKG